MTHRQMWRRISSGGFANRPAVETRKRRDEDSEDVHIDDKRKKVRFNPSVRVILIPTVAEYRAVCLGSLLWWDQEFYATFKKSAVSELLLFMTSHPSFTAKLCIKMLYQPDSLYEELLEQSFGQSTVLKTEVSADSGNLSKPLVLMKPCNGGGDEDLQPLTVVDVDDEEITASCPSWTEPHEKITSASPSIFKTVHHRSIESDCHRSPRTLSLFPIHPLSAMSPLSVA